MRLDGASTLAWRLQRHALEPVAGVSITDVAERVVAFRGWPSELADLMVRLRMKAPDAGALDRALDAGEVIRSYAFRGGSYVFTPEVASVLLACRTTTRVWETARYQQQGRFSLDDWQPWRDAVREVLSDGPATRDEIGRHIAGVHALKHLAEGATGYGSDTLYKPLFWWGDICFGPNRGGQATFRRLDGDPRWPGLPDVDTAGRRALELYLGSYGPATLDNLEYWLCDGLSVPRRRLTKWLAEPDDTITSVSVDGESAYVLSADVNQISNAEPSHSVRLLPGFDPWILGPGTADTRLLDPERRALATKGSNLLIHGGRVCGTWRVRSGDVAVSWFEEAGSVPTSALEREVERLSLLRGDNLSLTLAAP